MKRNKKMVIFSALAVLIALIQGAYGGIQVTASGGGNGESGSVSMNYDTLKSADVKSQIAINGATITPSTAIKGPIAKFEETHAVTDASGKSASVYVKVLNAPKGLTYASQVLPGEGNVDTKPQISAEQWLTVPKADSIKCTATASYGILFANVGMDEYKGTLKGDYVTLTGYYGKAVTTDALVLASQIATSGTANSIKIYGNATDSSGTYNVDTSLMGLSGGKATFAALSMSSSAGTTNQVEQNEHLHGTFTSTATYTPTIGTAQTKTMNSNYGTEYDLNMKAAQGSLPTGSLGYYVKLGTTASKIQGAVNAAQSGDTINVAAGKYAENVNLNKVLTLKGAGNPTATSFALNAILGTGSGGITAPIIYVNPTAKIQDGVNLASLKGTVNVAAGTYIENVQIDKSVTVNGAGQSTTIVDGNNLGSVFKIGSTNSNIDVTLSGLGITDGSGTPVNTFKWGGGVFNQGRTTIKDCRIFANSADYGGGVYNGGTATITGSTISENSAAWNGGGFFNAGTGTKLSVTGSTISRNVATMNGGGIHNVAGAKLTVTGSTISENSAQLDGGGFLNINGIATISGSTISKNTAINNGGGIASSGTLTVTGGTISENSANMGGGGGIYNTGTATVSSSVISGNSADGKGGGICNAATASKLTLSSSTITGNTATQCGGVYNGGTATITGGTISGNSAAIGGGIGNFYGTVNLNGVTVSNNRAGVGDTTLGESGGGIDNYHGTMNLKNVIVSNNQAYFGGGICNSFGLINLQGVTISNNIALKGDQWYDGVGGGIANSQGSTLNLISGSIDHNTAAVTGGGIFNTGSTIKGKTGIVHDNTPNQIVSV
jgi:hypothetical protein